MERLFVNYGQSRQNSPIHPMPHPTLHLTFCPVPPVRETISNSYCVSRIHRSQVTLVLMVLGMWDLAEHANPAVLAQQRAIADEAAADPARLVGLD